MRAANGKNQKSTITLDNPPLGSNLLVGSSNDAGFEVLNGVMDEFYIFDKTLSEREIQRLMNDACQGDSTSTTPGK